MICPKCGKQISDTARFCDGCGYALTGSPGVLRIQMRCRNCDGIMTAQEGNTVLVCPYCGSRELITDSKDVALEKIRIREEARRTEQKKEEEDVQAFESSAFRRILIIFAVLSSVFALLGFVEGYIVCGIIGSVQTILNLLSWLIGMHTIKTRRRNLPRALFLAGIMLILPYLIFFGTDSPSRSHIQTDYKWEDSSLAAKLPAPPSEKISVTISSDTLFSSDVYEIDSASYSSYVLACRDAGFSQDAVKDAYDYKAFLEDGTALELSYYEYAKQMYVRVGAPLALAEMVWPSSPLADLLPQPDYETGLLDGETPESLRLYIGETSRSKYAQYVQRCLENGFNVDYSRDSTYYHGNNQDGFRLTVEYYGFNIMVIHLYAPPEKQ